MRDEWAVGRQGWRYVLVSRTYSRPAFDQYRLAQAHGRVLRFWTKKRAQKMAWRLSCGYRVRAPWWMRVRHRILVLLAKIYEWRHRR